MDKTIKIGCCLEFSDFQQLERDMQHLSINAAMIYLGGPTTYRTRKINVAGNRHSVPATSLGVHGPYIINMANADAEKKRNGTRLFLNEFEIVTSLKMDYYVMHMGWWTADSNFYDGVQNTVDWFLQPKVKTLILSSDVPILLEIGCGKKRQMGSTLEEITYVLSFLDQYYPKEHFGVCLDTCHMWDGGYNFSGYLDLVIQRVEETCGIDRVGLVHVSGSQFGLGSHRDRHATIVQDDNQITKEVIYNFVRHKAWCGKPFILEVPVYSLTDNQSSLALDIEYLKGGESECS